MTGSGKSIARMRLLKKIGIIGLSVTSIAVAVVAAIAFFPKSSSAFSVHVDNTGADQKKNAHFTMTQNGEDGEKPKTYLSGKAVPNMFTTTASRLEGYLSSLEKFGGAQNWVENVVSASDSTTLEAHGLALVYTVFLNNTSNDEDQGLKYNVDLDGYKHIDSPIEYLRVAIQTQVEGSDEAPKTVYYGNPRTKDKKEQFGTAIENDPETNQREPIGDWALEGLEDAVLTSMFQSYGNDGYCVNFNDYRINKHIVEGVDIVIPAGKQMRFTYCCYLEGNDLDCDYAPEDTNFLMSLHFGV